MKPEHKELLMNDLCARLPYGVKLWHESYVDLITLHSIDATHCGVEISIDSSDSGTLWWNNIEQVKPYLFPLSSISEEIMDEIYNETGIYDIDVDSPVHIEVGTTFEDLTKMIHILHKYHIDYRGLIPMDLAIDATGKNIY
jgi:hypothetical protein